MPVEAHLNLMSGSHAAQPWSASKYVCEVLWPVDQGVKFNDTSCKIPRESFGHDMPGAIVHIDGLRWGWVVARPEDFTVNDLVLVEYECLLSVWWWL